MTHTDADESPNNQTLLNWHLQECVGDWLRRRLDEEGLSVYELAEKAGVGHVTLYRLLKSRDFFILRSNTRELLAWDKHSGKPLLGYYGYPPIFEEPQSLGYKKSNPLAISKAAREQLIKDDFLTTLDRCAWVEDLCDFTERPPEVFNEPCRVDRSGEVPVYEPTFDRLDTGEFIETGKDYNSSRRGNPYCMRKRVYLTSHITKQYGAISATRSKHFDIELSVKEDYLILYQHVLLMPIPELVAAIMNLHQFTQKQLGDELGLKNGQSLVSKLLNFNAADAKQQTIEFVNPHVVKKLVGLHVHGSLLDDGYFQITQRDAFLSLMSDLSSNGFVDHKHFSYHCSACVSATKSLLSIHSKLRDWNGESSLEVSCDLMITSDDSAIRVACFFSPLLDERALSFLIASATNLNATHICLLADEEVFDIDSELANGYICLNICTGIPRPCHLPMNSDYYSLHAILSEDEISAVRVQESMEMKASLVRAERDSYNYLADYFNSSARAISYDTFSLALSDDDDMQSIFQLFSGYLHSDNVQAFQKQLVLPIINQQASAAQIAKDYSVCERVIQELVDYWEYAGDL